MRSYFIITFIVIVVLQLTSSFTVSTFANIAQQRRILHKLFNHNSNLEPVIFEIVTKKVRSESISDDSITNIVAYESVYNDEKEDRVSIIMDNKVFSKVFSVLTNPLALIMSIYLIIVFYNKIGDSFNQFLSIFGKGKDKRLESTVSKLVELPYQVFECENCQMQMRPAKGRAEKIFGREKFRCSRCGAKASAYFNIDDTNDPRAIARIERIQQEENDENYGDDDEE